ncbi:sugar phosphate isomerase/epimerase family protein [Autumnicola musiva]|uniref:Sugar phosphate isomerase/epimerase family protein n=1 Tax=Autumnicola musiva TaxID=3075589 RepID=A0ABU3D3Z9_9FLAO|nr:sugar phosphate isomerase/epimerase family protein [Zunongwangia sp. F117]MDT0676252.1 sugar phosphate isomerase/epimerase family protein [Zunongwangia sp. F117]
MKKFLSGATGISSLLILILLTFASCKDSDKRNEQQADTEVVASAEDPFFKISLAQWSLHEPIMNGTMNPIDFAEKASDLGFEGIEYVSQLYSDKYKDAEDPEAAFKSLIDTLKQKSEEYNVRNVLIMVDNEGDLASPDAAVRKQAVKNHQKWVDAAQTLGCHSIRVNLFGSEDRDIWRKSAAAGLKDLAEYAAGRDINVLVENHGYLSSDANLLIAVMEDVNMENCGTLPDFGNFCLKREGGERWEASCVQEYPKYKGVSEMMPYAKAVSAKSYAFNDEGEETTIDYGKMLEIIKEVSYNSYVGVEYEGTNLSPEEGILATKELLIEKGTKLNSEKEKQ